MLGRPDVAIDVWERGHKEALAAGDGLVAARFALLVAMAFGDRGDMAQAGGWHGRAGQILEHVDEDCVERGYFLVLIALRALDEGDPGRALAVFEEIAALAERLGNAEGVAMSCLGRGQALMALGEIERGTALLDQAMVAVTLGEVSPINVGRVYCGSIEAFQAVYDIGRAQEWTGALNDWCESQPDAVPFRGRCLVFRAELLQLHGQWVAAAEEVDRARDWLLRPPPEPAAGEAFYQQAELHRVRGELRDAEADYREAAKWGRRPDPGIALLRLIEGDTRSAAASIRRALDEWEPVGRIRLLEPFVEIMLAAGDLEAARRGMAELHDAVRAPRSRAAARGGRRQDRGPRPPRRGRRRRIAGRAPSLLGSLANPGRTLRGWPACGLPSPRRAERLVTTTARRSSSSRPVRSSTVSAQSRTASAWMR